MSILHYDKLSQKRKYTFLHNPEQFTCQEKVDGTGLQIDIEGGEISIRQGRYNVYRLDGWDYNFWTTDYREAHQFITQNHDELLRAYGEYAEIKAEILSVNHPNTIQYDQSVNRILVFSPYDNIDIYGQVVNFKYPSTEDGITTTDQYRTTDWHMQTLPSIPQEEWVDVIHNLVDYEYDHLLNLLVRNRVSLFGKTRIEGLVFRHSDGWQFKLVDRQYFTDLNNRNQELRRKLFRSSYQRDMTVMDIHTQESRIDSLAASKKALVSIDRLFNAYLADPNTQDIDPWVHARNLEAVVSLRNQLNGIINGR